MKNNSIILRKPMNLVLEELISSHRPYFIKIRKDDGYYTIKMVKGKNLRKQIPAMYYFINVLLERIHLNQTNQNCKYLPEYKRMYSRDIEPVKSKNDFKFIWNLLYQLKVIRFTFDNVPTKYKKSAQAYYFKLHEKYENQQVVEHEVEFKEVIFNKLIKNQYMGRNNNSIEPITKHTGLKYYSHQYNLIQNISYDFHGAEKYIKMLLNSGKIDNDKYNNFFIHISNLRSGKLVFKKSEKCNRLYTSVNMMPKVLRNFIKDKYENPLEELDFGSFNAFAVYKIINEINLPFKSNVHKISFESEVDLYRRLLSGGNFYEDIASIVFPDEEFSRDAIKEIVLHRWLNGRINSRNKYRKALKERFPEITTIVDAIKDKRYSDFANLTMTFENELVTEIIYQRFIERHPDATIYIIFDSLLVDQEHASKLHSFMVEEGRKFFNLNCIVKAKT